MSEFKFDVKMIESLNRVKSVFADNPILSASVLHNVGRVAAAVKCFSRAAMLESCEVKNIIQRGVDSMRERGFDRFNSGDVCRALNALNRSVISFMRVDGVDTSYVGQGAVFRLIKHWFQSLQERRARRGLFFLLSLFCHKPVYVRRTVRSLKTPVRNKGWKGKR